MIRVLQFADVINRHDFIDVIVQNADPSRFLVGACVRRSVSNIAPPVYGTRTPHWVIPGEGRASIPLAVARLARLLHRWDADILHTHHFDQAIIGWLATRLRRKTRLIIGRHYSDAIYRLSHGAKQKALLKLEALSNRAATRIVVPSSHIACMFQGGERDKTDLVHYGFEPAKYSCPSQMELRQFRHEYGLEDRLSIGTFGRLSVEKGHPYLLDAACSLRRAIPNVLFLLVGDGPERESISHMIRECGLQETVRMTGSRRDVMTVMSAVDMVVQPSLSEAFSQVMVEAMWLRKPLIITEVSGAADVVRHGENGWIVPRADAGALANAISTLATDTELREQLGAQARAFVEEHLNIRKIISQYERCYLRAMDGIEAKCR